MFIISCAPRIDVNMLEAGLAFLGMGLVHAVYVSAAGDIRDLAHELI